MQEQTEYRFRQWVESIIKANFPENQNNDVRNWIALPGDAGQRQYFRVELEAQSFIAVLYPSENSHNIEHFHQLAVFFQRHHISTPNIFGADEEQGFVLLQDFGDVHLLDVLDSSNADALYGSAIVTLLSVQMCDRTERLPPYSQERLEMELGLFREWFVGKMLGHTLNEGELRMLNSVDSLLVNSALEQPQVVVHRDYHSRNLLYRPGESLGVIDFQDAVIGPVTYDVVSLLRDCYVHWPADQVSKWALSYKRLAENAAIFSHVEDQQFLLWFDLMGFQRHLKVLGIFSRLSLRDDKHRYLSDLPRVIKYVRDIAAKHAVLSEFYDWFEEVISPLSDKKNWMKNAV